MAEFLQPGTQAPDFTLPADDGSQVTLSQLHGKPVVLYFYPRDDTPGCTREACSFRDRQSEMQNLGATVLGVSPDGVASHEEFRDKFTAQFPPPGSMSITTWPSSTARGEKRSASAKTRWASNAPRSSSTPPGSSARCGKASKSTATTSK